MNETLGAASPVTGWRHAFGLLLLLPLLLIGPSPAGAKPAAPVPALEFHEAEYSADGGATWSRVALPDTWAQRGLRTSTAGRYRVAFELPAQPVEPVALMLERLSSQRRVWVNGAFVAGEDETPETDNRGRPVPTLIHVPPSLLHAGTNRVEFAVTYKTRGGLSAIVFGPTTGLRERYEHFVTRYATLPRALNMAAAGLALYMLTIWWRRRGELALGSFGALSLVGALRNYSYFGTVPLWSVAFTDWLYYSSQVATTVLLGVFAQALAGRWRAYQRWLIVLILALPLAGLGAVMVDRLDLMRRLTYPLLTLASLPALVMILRYARERGGGASAALALSLLALVISGVHDYAYQTGSLDITGSFWLPYGMPVALACLAVMLAGRMVSAITEVEALNVDLERRVAERTRALEAANAAKTRFLASASHDLRQPVVTIGLLVGLVREQASVLPSVRPMLDRIHDAVVSMDLLLKGLMDLSRFDSGTVEPRLQPVALAPLFESIDLHEQTAAVLKDLRLHFRARQLSVRADPVLLEQIVRNLVGNALRYTRRGGVLVSARRRGPDIVRLQVWDTGCGIAEAAQGQVFEEFMQLDNPGRDRSKGLGLGLAIVQRSAGLLGTRVSLRSVPGRGSCFTLDLPFAPHAGAAPAAAQASPPALPLSGVPVWLIEDDAAVREALSARLRHWGARVVPLAGRADVQRRLDATTTLPALIVSDQRLRDGTGLDCIAQIRAHSGRALPAVIVTGDTAPADLALLAGAGLPVLHKPFSADELLVLLREALGVGADGADAAIAD
jgi:signal transduction histidine kinase/ActR/RegA family two-component response regulator